MSAEPFDLNAVELSSSVTVGEYRRMEKAKCICGLAEFIRQRLSERYITPLTAIHRTMKNGFHTMAISCLLIETMEAFREGWSTTDKTNHLTAILNACKPANSKGDRVRRSKIAFCYFFEREAPFVDLRGRRSYEFYDNVRCA